MPTKYSCSLFVSAALSLAFPPHPHLQSHTHTQSPSVTIAFHHHRYRQVLIVEVGNLLFLLLLRSRFWISLHLSNSLSLSLSLSDYQHPPSSPRNHKRTGSICKAESALALPSDTSASHFRALIDCRSRRAKGEQVSPRHQPSVCIISTVSLELTASRAFGLISSHIAFAPSSNPIALPVLSADQS